MDDNAMARKIAMKAHRRVLLQPRLLIVCGACAGLCAGASIAFCDWALITGWSRWAITFPVVCAGQLVYVRLVRNARRAEISRILQSQGSVCIKCGFDLRAGGSDRCPECGTLVKKPPA